MSLTEERKRLIRAATLEAVKRRNEIAEANNEGLREAYGATVEVITKAIERARKDGNRVAADALQPLLYTVRNAVEALGKTTESRLSDAIDAAIAAGAGVFAKTLGQREIFTASRESLMFVQHFSAADGLQLSERLWRIKEGAKATLSQHIQYAILHGESAHQAAANALQGRQTLDYATQQALQAATPDALKTSITRLMVGDSSTAGQVWQAERVFRTEINRAHGEAYMNTAAKVDGFRGFRFNLSPNHRRRDVCDVHASADLYGLGSGVYPTRDACPWPAHPNTISYVTAEFD